MGNVLKFPLVAVGVFHDQDWKIPRKSWILNCIFYSVWILILLVLFWNISINFDKTSKTYIFALKEWCSFLLDGVSGFSSVFLKGNTFYFTPANYCTVNIYQYKYYTLKCNLFYTFLCITRTVCTEHCVDEKTKWNFLWCSCTAKKWISLWLTKFKVNI